MPTSPAFTSVFQVVDNSSQVCWSIGFIGSRAPALRMSTSGISSRTTEFISVASVASPATTAAPACSAAESFARSRPIAVTFAPQAASDWTIASPSPWLPPVMTTRFPFRFCMFILLTRASGVVVVDDVVGEAVERGERCDLRVVSDHIRIGSHRFQTIPRIRACSWF